MKKKMYTSFLTVILVIFTVVGCNSSSNEYLEPVITCAPIEVYENKAILNSKLYLLETLDAPSQILCNGEEIIQEKDCYLYTLYVRRMQNDGERDHYGFRNVGVYGIAKDDGTIFCFEGYEEWVKVNREILF